MASVTQYQISAALWVIRAVDEDGTDAPTLSAAFHNAVTQGRFPRPDLDNAHDLLLDCGLLVRLHGMVRHHGSLDTLLPLTDRDALPLLARLLSETDAGDEQDDEAKREALGVLGEDAVVAWCVAELQALGHSDLAKQVQRVSLISDRFGYDVSAPSTRDEARMLEVKTSGAASGKIFRFFLTRNEYEVGRRHPRRWALVACHLVGDDPSVVGWCRASELERYLPDDANGRWTEALVDLPINALLPGAPSAVS